MPDNAMMQALVSALPGGEAARRVSFAAGDHLFRSGDPCRHFVVIVAGCVRIQLASRTGRDVLLFRLHPGQSCALTTSCLFRKVDYYAEGLAETPVEALIIPATDFDKMVAASPALCSQLIGDFAGRVADLTGRIDKLTSRDLDADIAGELLARLEDGTELRTSHQGIAAEIGTACEVVSRKLKEMEKAGLLRLGRGRVAILQPDTLRAMARRDTLDEPAQD